MIPSTISKRVMIVLALIGALAVLTGAVLGIGASRSVATAAPASYPVGTLGLGSESIAPLATPSGTSHKFDIPTSSVAVASLTTHAALSAAPIPKPVRTRGAAAGATGITPARSAASAGGWKSARVSWYGPGFYGRKTASGAVLTEGMMNVAHRSLPFGTRIQFEYKGRTCIAVVNDRGPFVGGRAFDLGPGTATTLGFGGVGTVKYRILGR